mmetsp:Transcript_20251/g.34859  ORF Transcript_20251/g.34859 Transcript_20251/m.34859 type:complete len:94 (-) Transcript_20251:82-363(-)
MQAHGETQSHWRKPRLEKHRLHAAESFHNSSFSILKMGVSTTECVPDQPVGFDNDQMRKQRDRDGRLGQAILFYVAFGTMWLCSLFPSKARGK